MSKRGEIIEVCRSRRKGETKTPVGEGRLIEDFGLEGDAHAGTERQVSLLCAESAEKIRSKGLDVGPGDFAENLLVGDLSPGDFRPGTRFRIPAGSAGGGALLEVTRIGKECHQDCAIRRQVGDCVMPREGVFARVIEGGLVRAGDVIEVLDAPSDPRAEV